MVRFKYSLTLWIEENGVAIMALPFAIALTVVANNFNSFEGGLYYFINIVGFVVGYIAGLITWLATTSWMSNRTIWASEWEDKYGKSFVPVRYDNSKVEKPVPSPNSEDNISSEERWRDIHISFAFGKTPIQTFLFFLVCLILVANEYSNFKANGITYSTRVFLDSSVFYIAFLYVSSPIFVLTKYLLAMSNASYTFGSFWHKSHLFTVLIINSIAFGYAAYYSHQLFLSFS